MLFGVTNESGIQEMRMTPNGWKTETRRLLVLAVGVAVFAALAFGCAWVIEVLWLEEALGLSYTFRVVTLTPIIEESLKILPFSLAGYLLHHYRGIGMKRRERIGGIWLIGAGFGFLEGVVIYHMSGIYLLSRMLVHGSMSGVAGFFKSGILASILLHVITNSSPDGLFDVWQCLLVVTFLIAVLILVVKYYVVGRRVGSIRGGNLFDERS